MNISFDWQSIVSITSLIMGWEFGKWIYRNIKYKGRKKDE